MSSAPDTQNDTDLKRKSWWPTGIVVGLGIVFAANAVMITLALTNPSHPAVEDHWELSLRYDEEIAKNRASAQLGWVADVSISPDAQLQVELQDSQGAPLAVDTLQVDVTRGDRTDLDRSFQLSKSAVATYTAGWPDLQRGYYNLVISAKSGDTDWVFRTRRFFESPQS